MKIRDNINKILCDALADAYKSGLLMLKEEFTDAYTYYHDEVEGILAKCDIKEKESYEQVLKVHAGLEMLFKAFVRAHISDLADLANAYVYYLYINKHSEWSNCLKKHHLRADQNWLFENIEDFNTISSLYGVNIDYETDYMIKSIGRLSRLFLFEIEEKDIVVKESVIYLESQVYSVFETYVKNQLEIYYLIKRRFGENKNFSALINEKLAESFKFAYENLLHYLSHFKIHEEMDKKHVFFNHEKLLMVLPADEFSILIRELNELIKNYNDKKSEVLDQLFKASCHFYERAHNRIDASILAEETRNQMIEILTAYIDSEYPSGDVNKVVTAFGSFIFLYDQMVINKCNLRKMCKDKIDMNIIYNHLYKSDVSSKVADTFKTYLQYIFEGNMDKAIEIYPEYEYPHYYKVINFMKDIYLSKELSLDNISETADNTQDRVSSGKLYTQHYDVYNMSKEQWLAIGEHISHLKDLESVLLGKRVQEGLPSLNDGFIDFLVEVLGTSVKESPMVKFCSYFIHIVKLVVKNIKQQEKIEALNKSLQESIEAQQDMVRNYSHSWKHVVYPGVVKDVALDLMTDIEEDNIDLEDIRLKHRDYSDKLMKAYRAENILKRQGEMLIIKHSASNSALQELIRNDILRPGAAEEGVCIFEVLEESLEIILFGLIMREEDASNTDKGLRKKIFREEELSKVREDFSKKFVLGKEKASIIQWFSDNIYSLVVTDIDPNWAKIRLLPTGNAAVFFIDIFTELFYNALKYGETDKKSAYIKVLFYTCTIDEEELLVFEIKNTKSRYLNRSWGTGAGLRSLNRLLNKVNQESYSNKDYVLQCEEGEEYSTKVQLAKSMFIKRGLRI